MAFGTTGDRTAAPAATSAVLSLLDRLPVAEALDALDRARGLDPGVKVVRGAVQRLPLGRAREVLHGRWLGHPLHPGLVQVPMGAWLSAGVLDLVPRGGRGAGVLVAVGLVTAVPAAAAGATDWAELRTPQLRTGLVHAAANTVAIGLYGASLVHRMRGRRFTGRLLGFAGLGAVGAGAALGGHLSYRQGAGVNKSATVPAVVGEEWLGLGRLDDFPVGQATPVQAAEVPLLVYRSVEGEVYVLGARCSHEAGPLWKGEIVEGCVVCPWHGSTFRLDDGENVAGPAIAPQPSFATRQRDGVLEVRLEHAPPAAS